MSFAKNIGKNLSNKYIQKLIDSLKKSTTNVTKIASKRAVQKTVKATSDLLGNKTADKITSVSKKYPKNNLKAVKGEEDIPKERYISPEKR